MKTGRVAANASLVSLSLALLAACGGGSGGGPVSTPGPAPAPSPSATPTPGTSNPPSGANDDLLTPLASETFSTFAVRGSASYPLDGSPGSSSAGNATLSISYDANARTYRVSTGGTQQTFGNGQIDQSLSNSQITTYVSQNGSTTNSLLLTKPGTSGSLTYRWVGAGLWERSTQSSSSISADVNAFVYGIRTPQSGVPASGSASYDVDMLGVYATQVGAQSLVGSGNLAINFGSGAISGAGNATGTNVVTGGQSNHSWNSSANLSSAGSIAGTLTLGGVNAIMNGALYGPEGQEVGAAFGGSGGGNSVIGTLTGRQSGNININNPAPSPAPTPTPSPAPSPTPTPTPVATTMLDRIATNTTFQTAGTHFLIGSGYDGVPWGTGARVRYIVSSDTVRLILPDGRQLDFETPDVPSGFPFADSETFRITDAGGDTLQQFSVSPPIVGGVRLTYTRWGSFIDLGPDTPGMVNTASFFFGIPTNDMPVSGNATYTTSVIAAGMSGGAFYSFSDSTAAFSADFGAGSIATAINLIGAPTSGGATTDFGTFSGTGTIDGFAIDGAWTSIAGEFHGSFFGPAAEEMGYTFWFDNGVQDGSGFVAGRKD